MARHVRAAPDPQPPKHQRRAHAIDIPSLTAGDHPRDARTVDFLSPQLARWIAFVVGGTLVLVALLIAAGFWAKRRVTRL
jgi:hypothetical protein